MPHLSFRIRAYLHHLREAGTWHDVHSPFVFGLIEHVLRKSSLHVEFTPIERLRIELLKSDRRIHVTDLGAGPKRKSGPERFVRDIASSALKPRKQAELLFRLARYFSPAAVLELGTSFGLTTLYLARGASTGHVHTIEGCPETVAIARHHFDLLNFTNITSVQGSFSERLPQTLRAIDRLDLVFIDGHHAMIPTLKYFEQCLDFTHDNSVLIIDDIHWTPDMEAAWEAIKVHPRVTVTVDLFHMGLVFLRKEQEREHFRLRY